jgi:hypothetical protein
MNDGRTACFSKTIPSKKAAEIAAAVVARDGRTKERTTLFDLVYGKSTGEPDIHAHLFLQYPDLKGILHQYQASQKTILCAAQ